jgi:hypothetical protein
VMDQIADLGTFAIEAYLASILEITAQPRLPFVWIVSSVDEVYEEKDAFVLSGDAVPFGK